MLIYTLYAQQSMTDGSQRANDSEIVRTLTETTKMILFEIDDLKDKLSTRKPLGSSSIAKRKMWPWCPISVWGSICSWKDCQRIKRYCSLIRTIQVSTGHLRRGILSGTMWMPISTWKQISMPRLKKETLIYSHSVWCSGWMGFELTLTS